MPRQGYFGKRGTIRLYSNTSDGAGGTYFYEIPYELMDFAGPGGRARPDELPVLDRGVGNTYTHFVQGPDTPIIAGQTLTFTCQIENTNKAELYKALCNPEQVSPWSVGGQTWTNVNGTTSLVNGFGSSFSTPPPYDVNQDRIHLAVIWQGNAAGADDTGFKYNEVWVPPEQIRLGEAPDRVTLGITARIYGPVSAITALPAGTNVAI